jgi:hypothetical protein
VSTFQPKLQFLAPLLENTTFVQNDFTLVLRILRFFPKKDQSNFQSPLQRQSFRNIGSQTSIYPVPKAKLPVSDFVLLVPSMPDICVTMLFMVFCCCSTDIILNRFPVGRNDRFPLHNYDRTSLQTAIDLKRGSLYAWSICISSKLFEVVRVSLPFPSVRICPSRW